MAWYFCSGNHEVLLKFIRKFVSSFRGNCYSQQLSFLLQSFSLTYNFHEFYYVRAIFPPHKLQHFSPSQLDILHIYINIQRLILINVLLPPTSTIISSLFAALRLGINVSNLEIPMHHLSFTFHDVAENQFVEWLLLPMESECNE